MKEITPELAKAGAEARLLSEGQYPADTGVVFGEAVFLPVEDDEYDVLCGKAGEAVCKVVMKPFEGINQYVTSALESACKGFAKSLSNWFCDDQSGGGGSRDFPINRKQDMLYPRMAQTKDCEKGDKNACQWLQDAAPNKTGFCQKNGNCSAYETFVAAAREQCEPTQDKKPKSTATSFTRPALFTSGAGAFGSAGNRGGASTRSFLEVKRRPVSERRTKPDSSDWG